MASLNVRSMIRPNSWGSLLPKDSSHWEVIVMARTVILYVLLWYIFSIGITFYNKWLFTWHGFHFPLSVTTVHMICTAMWANAGRRYLSWAQGVQYKKISWKLIGTKIFPAGVTAALDIGLSNAAIGSQLHINLYTIGKSTVVVWVLVFGILAKLIKPSWKIAGIVLLVVGGVIIFQSDTDMPIHSGGFLLVLIASMFGGLRWVLTQILLKQSDIGLNGTVDSLYYVAPCMAISLLPFAVFKEGHALIHSDLLFAAPPDIAFLTSAYIFAGAALAFFLTLSEFLVVEYAGSLTLSLGGIFKELITMVVAAAFVSGNELNGIKVLGLFISLMGIGLYNHMKYKEHLKPQPKSRSRIVDLGARGDPEEFELTENLLEPNF
eukprot:m.84250 g.84250  ORF g.84250 m.84250 type:complete len:378 (+) comp25727_c0_seq1:172-1305(+)